MRPDIHHNSKSERPVTSHCFCTGTLYAQSGEVADAQRYFKLALQKDPKHEDAKAKLKQVHEMASHDGDEDMPKFRSPMKRVGGERKERVHFEL